MKKKYGIVIGFIIGIILLLAVVGIVVSSNRKKEEENKEVSNPQVEEDFSEEKLEEEELEEEQQDEVVEEEVQEEKPETEEPEKEIVEEPEEPVQKPEEPENQTVTTPKVEAIPGQHRDPNSAVVVIDPGHQAKGDSTKEPNGPGSSTMKARVTWGTTGVSTGVAEYVLNLDISLKLKTELENRGYTVYMTRSTHDVNISNMERAQYATSVGADIAVRIHANSIDKSSVAGAETLAPSSSNAYVGHLANASKSLSQNILDAYCNATGFKNRGVKINDTMTGINWSEVPVTILELGFMSNVAEDQAMQDETMQNNMVQGIANGIDTYFGF